MATIAQELSASQDADLLKRATQAAQRQRIPNAQHSVEANIGLLVSLPAGAGSAQTIADVHAYAVSEHAKAVAALDEAQAELNAKRAALASPGADPTRVTDEYIMYAIGVLFKAPNSSEHTTVGEYAR